MTVMSVQYYICRAYIIHTFANLYNVYTNVIVNNISAAQEIDTRSTVNHNILPNFIDQGASST